MVTFTVLYSKRMYRWKDVKTESSRYLLFAIIIYPLMKYIIPLVVPSLQEFFLSNIGGDHNGQTNSANSSQDDLPVSEEVKIQNSSAR